jgi:serine/threonine-protein kinase
MDGSSRSVRAMADETGDRATQQLVAGTVFAGCRLEGIAARGGMGVVWKATQLALGRPVALKAIAPDLAESADYRERFQRESQLTASIEHPNVIPVYEAGELDGTLYLITRWVDGTDLHRMLRQCGRLEPDHALGLLRPVASALAAAHRRDLIHRDIKPANVLVASENEHVYLTDFGIARLTNADAVTRTGALVGTIDYTAPERFEGGHGDAASDIYAFGCMLYETLTGSVPFKRPTDVSKLFAHVNEPPPSVRASIPNLPESIDEIVTTAMAKRPEDRYASADELVDALTAARMEIETVGRLPTAASAGVTTGGGDTTSVRTRPGVTAGGAGGAASTAAEAQPAAAGRRRSRYLVGGTLVVIAGVIAAVAIAAGGGGGGGGGAAHGVTATAATPAAAGEVAETSGNLHAVQTIRLPGEPVYITSSEFGGVGVAIPADGQIAWLTRNGPRAQPFPVGGQPSTIASGKLGAWVGCSHAGPLVRVGLIAETRARATGESQCPIALIADPRDESIWAAYPGGRVIHYGADGGSGSTSAAVGVPVTGLAIGQGDVWAADGALVRIDPRTGAHRSFQVGPGAISVAVDTNGVWVAHPTGNLTRFDPGRGVTANITVGPSLTQVAAEPGAAAVWAIGHEGVYEVSPTSFDVIGKAQLRSTPVGITLANGSAFVATSDGHLVRFSAPGIPPAVNPPGHRARPAH